MMCKTQALPTLHNCAMIGPMQTAMCSTSTAAILLHELQCVVSTHSILCKHRRICGLLNLFYNSQATSLDLPRKTTIISTVYNVCFLLFTAVCSSGSVLHMHRCQVLGNSMCDTWHWLIFPAGLPSWSHTQELSVGEAGVYSTYSLKSEGLGRNWGQQEILG